MTRANYHLPPIPDGFQIYEERLEVAGLTHRKAGAARFARGKQRALEWEPEPGNRYDKNAIRLIGCHKGIFLTKRTLLGYVPKEVANTLVERGFVEDAQPRLLKTYVSDGGFVEILFQIVGPKARISDYKGTEESEERQHYTDAVEQVKQLKRDKRHDEAIALLQDCVEETEAESRKNGAGWGVAPWYYEQLAILYRKERRYADEVNILERYPSQPHAPGAGPAKLAERLEKARQLLERTKA